MSNDGFPRSNPYENNNNSCSNPFNNGYNPYEDNSNNNYNNNNYNPFNNFNNNSNYLDGSLDSMMIVDTWKRKIKTYNDYIDEGKFSFHGTKLKEGIREILEAMSLIENKMNQCMDRGDDSGRKNLANIKSDMEQTCYRFECQKNNKKIEKFYSAFDGNSKRYYFDKNNLFSQKQYIPYSHVEQENKVLSGFEMFGNKIKDGAFFVGRKIKYAAV